MSLDFSFIIVNEQPGGREDLEILLHDVEFESCRDGFGGAAANSALIIDSRAVTAHVDAGRQRRERDLRSCVKMVSGVREVRYPAVPGCLPAGRYPRQ